MHPTITRESQEFAIWRDYFDRHLDGRPWCFKALAGGTIAEMTIPEQFPQWFDPSFSPSGQLDAFR